jgi:hypothetical protein
MGKAYFNTDFGAVRLVSAMRDGQSFGGVRGGFGVKPISMD